MQAKSERVRRASVRSVALSKHSNRLGLASEELLQRSRKLREVLAGVQKRLLDLAKNSRQERF